MRICVTSSGPNLDSLIDPRFGRCLYFIFVDDGNLEEINAFPNKGIDAARGAGVQSAQAVVDQKAEVVITGNVGPNSFEVLNSSGIRIFKAMSGMKIKDALSAFKQSQLPEITQSVGAGFGVSGQGRGLGRGRGLGQGRRR